MTTEERLRRLRLKGLSDRQATFVLTVMLHAGVCLGRHYCAFARIPYGQKMHDFFRMLLDRGFATARACRHNRARIYHIHYKPLYHAIGEPNNRHRRPMSLAQAIERMMLLDAVLSDPAPQWLATEWDKVSYFTLTHRVPRHDLPALVFPADDTATTRYFPDKLPIGLARDGRAHIFTYLVTRDEPVDFRAFLERHAELLRALPSWRIRLLVPRHKTDAIPLYEAAFREQLTTPLRPIVVEDLRRYFHARRTPPIDLDEQFDQATRAFAAPRFRALYRAWQKQGESVLQGALSSVLADTVARGSGHWEPYVLPHNYVQLLPLVGTA